MAERPEWMLTAEEMDNLGYRPRVTFREVAQAQARKIAKWLDDRAQDVLDHDPRGLLWRGLRKEKWEQFIQQAKGEDWRGLMYSEQADAVREAMREAREERREAALRAAEAALDIGAVAIAVMVAAWAKEELEEGENENGN